MSDRLCRIVEDLAIQPVDRVLEIGCGQGVAASYICERLTTGHLIAVDRSEKMIAAARKRNAKFMAAGKVEFICADFEELELGIRRFDKILAVRVRLFHSDPERARALAETWLAPNGRLVNIYDQP